MKINYLPTFIKDLKDLKSTSSYSVIKNLVFTDILAVKQLSEINNLKKLKGEYNAYRIRIGDYRIGFFVEEDTITFARVLHRRESPIKPLAGTFLRLDMNQKKRFFSSKPNLCD